MRNFEKISFNQFKKDVSDDEKIYQSFSLPKRSTKTSAGYDIYSLIDFTLEPDRTIKIPTGLKVKMDADEVLLMFSRSSQGYKYDVCLSNSVGVIDSDYYNNSSNEGHFSIKLHNHGDKPYVVKIGDAIAQGIFVKYLTVDNEEYIDNERTGGIGSTEKGEKND